MVRRIGLLITAIFTALSLVGIALAPAAEAVDPQAATPPTMSAQEVPPGNMHVIYIAEHSFVLALNWVEGTELVLTVERVQVEVHSEAGIVDSEDPFGNITQHWFTLEGFGLARGDVVTITGGGSATTHQVTDLTLDFVDLAADTVHGTSSTATEVCVHIFIWPDPPPVVCAPVINGAWVADFSAVYDITAMTHMGSFERDEDGDATQVDWIVPSEVEIAIDIRPDTVNLEGRGVIPVAILTTEDFDATTVAPISAAFGPAGASEAHGRGHFSDVDYDGDIDLMLHFRTHEAGIQPGDTQACLTAQTSEGQTIVGCDLITTG